MRRLHWIGRLGVIVLLGASVAQAQSQSQSPGSPSAPAEPPASSVPPLPELPNRRGEIIRPGIPAPAETRSRAFSDPRCGTLLDSQRRVTPGCQ